MRKAIVISFVAAIVGAGAFALAASGGDSSSAPVVDVNDANARTAQAASVHYSVAIRLTHRHVAETLHIRGAASQDKQFVRLQLGLVSGSIMRNKTFLYESAPKIVQMFGNVSWLRLTLDGFSQSSQVMATLRDLTPAPLLHVIAEAKLRHLGHGAFTGTVAYDDPIVRTSLHDLNGGIEFRGLRMRVFVGRDGLVHRVHLTGRTFDGKTTLDLHARLFGFGRPVSVTPPKPGSFMDPQLLDLQA